METFCKEMELRGMLKATEDRNVELEQQLKEEKEASALHTYI